MTSLLLAAVLAVAPAQIEGLVVKVTDGDTITVLVDQQQLKIRLDEIDAPERKQPWGSRSREALATLLAGKQVRVVTAGTDKYKRLIGRIYVGDLDVNAEQVRTGNAWAYRKYVKRLFLLDLETEAKEARLGLWSLPESERQPPWEWRKYKREQQ